MIDIRRILAPVDFSTESRHSLDHAVALAKWYGAKIVVQYVAPVVPGPLPVAGFGLAEPPLVPTEELRQRLEVFAESANQAGLVESFCLDVGAPAAEILARAATMSVGLIVLGTHGYGGFERFILGSVAEKVLRKATCPVVTVPPRSGSPDESGSILFKTILCAVDLEDDAVPGALGPSAHALIWAASLAQANDAHLVALHVIEHFPSADPRALMHFDMPSYRSFLELDAKERLGRLVSAHVPGTRLEDVYVSGKPHREIVRVAKEKEASLIVMAVRDRGAVDRALFGSTASQVVREAECPVLTVKRG